MYAVVYYIPGAITEHHFIDTCFPTIELAEAYIVFEKNKHEKFVKLLEENRRFYEGFLSQNPIPVASNKPNWERLIELGNKKPRTNEEQEEKIKIEEAKQAWSYQDSLLYDKWLNDLWWPAFHAYSQCMGRLNLYMDLDESFGDERCLSKKYTYYVKKLNYYASELEFK